MPSKKEVTIFIFLALFLVWGAIFFGNFPYTTFSQAQRPIDPSSLTGIFDSTQVLGQFQGQTVASGVVTPPALARVLGTQDTPKRIEVDLANQRLFAFEGNHLVFDFVISSGKYGRTPTGTFKIWSKFLYTKMEGGSKLNGSYYYLPNVPYVMFFSNDQVAQAQGFSLHGTYWHNNFGYPMSHGCINLKTSDAEQLYKWTTPNLNGKNSVRADDNNSGTEVIIYGVAPQD